MGYLKIFIGFSLGSIVAFWMYYSFFSPYYNPETSVYLYDNFSMEWGLEIGKKNKKTDRKNLIVEADIDFNQVLDSCFYIVGYRIDPIDDLTGKCPPEWCLGEGYFIIDKRTSNVISGMNKDQFESLLSSYKPYMLGGGGILSHYTHRFSLSIYCPDYERQKQDSELPKKLFDGIKHNQ